MRDVDFDFAKGHPFCLTLAWLLLGRVPVSVKYTHNCVG